MVGDESPQGGAGLVMGETLLAGREQECTRNRARGLRSCFRALVAWLIPGLL